MKPNLCEYILDGIPITWQDLIKEAAHIDKTFRQSACKWKHSAIRALVDHGHTVEKNPDYQET